MAKQYNVNIVGDLTNDNGVLSGFSVNDYATLPVTLEGLTINSLEIVFKFKTNSLSSNNAIFWTDKLTDDPTTLWAGLRLCNYNADNDAFDLEVTDNNAQIANIYDSTSITPDTYYYIKALYSDVDGYSLYNSEDGENYTLIGTNATTTMPPNSQAIIGRAVDIDPMPFDGSIDLNGSYIKVNGAYWWRGVTNTTTIQLRRDTTSSWSTVNPVLAQGEIGLELDTKRGKIGDGSTAWNSLSYATMPPELIEELLNDKADNFEVNTPLTFNSQWNSSANPSSGAVLSSAGILSDTITEDYWAVETDILPNYIDNQMSYWEFNVRFKSSTSNNAQPIIGIADGSGEYDTNFIELHIINGYLKTFNETTTISIPTNTWIDIQIIHEENASTASAKLNINGTEYTINNVIDETYTLSSSNEVVWVGLGVSPFEFDVTWDGFNCRIEPDGVRYAVLTDKYLGVGLDATPTSSSSNLMTSGSIYTALSGYVSSSTLNNYVTLATDQDITGIKTFVGQKRIGFKQSSSSDKLGFNLYNNSGTEKGYLEFNPSNLVDGVPLMTLGNYASASTGLTHVGFRKYSNVSGANGAYNLLAPLISDARTPFSLTTTYTNFYLPLGFTDGTTTVTTAKSGVVDISSLLPTIPTVDQTYDRTSTNAQSGVAIAGAGFLTGISSSDVTTALEFTPENSANKVTSLSSNSTDTEYPSAKLTYDQLVLKQDNITSSAMLSSDLVDDTNKTHKFATSAQLTQIGTNQTDISTINGKIPSQASSNNQLADKAFVNSTVQTSTANFRGNWEDWTDVPISSSDYPEDYAGSKIPTVNDYLVVQDASDYTGDTLEGTWRFKYTGTWSTDGKSGWIPEYQVNETPLTASQLAALNSGITSDKVAEIDIKQNQLIAGDYISLAESVGWTAKALNTELSVANQWVDIAYGNNKYVALDLYGYISTSTDGSTWTTAVQDTNLGSHTWTHITYGNNIFVAIGSAGYISTSTDGSTWTTAVQSYALSTVNDSWQGLAYDGTKFVAVTNSSSKAYVSTSTDGTTWTTPAQNNNLISVYMVFLIYDGTKFIGLGSTGYVVTSTDGTTWATSSTRIGSTNERQWRSLAYNGTVYIALDKDGYVSISTNATTWTSPVQDTNLDSSQWRALCSNPNTGLVIAIDRYGNLSFAEPATLISTTGLQPTLTSGTNIKTINNTSVLGSGNFSLLPTTGGTLTGTLITAMTDSVPVRIRQTSNYSTATTAGTTYNDVQFEDYTGTRRSTIRSHYTYDENGTLTTAKLIIGTNGLNSSAPTGIEIGTNTGGSWVGVSITPGATSSTSSTNLPNCGWVNDPTKSTNVVHRSGDETIAGNKTFNGTVTGTTTNATVSTTQVCTTASARNLQTLQPITTVSGSSISLSHNYSIYKSTPNSATTYTFSTTNITQATSSVAYTFELCVVMTSTVYALTFPSSVSWQNGEAPDLSATGTYFFVFRTIDGGTTWLGNLQGRW